MEIARLVLGVLLLVAFALLTVQLYNGRWLFLIAKPEKTKKGTFFPEGTANTGKRAAWVMVACFAGDGALMAYEMSKMTGVLAFAQTSILDHNIALVVFCLSSLDAVRGSRRAELIGTASRRTACACSSCCWGACARRDGASDLCSSDQRSCVRSLARSTRSMSSWREWISSFAYTLRVWVRTVFHDTLRRLAAAPAS